MSMYTQLLGAALGDRLPFVTEPSRTAAVAEVRRCRHDLEARMPAGAASRSVPVVLALQVGYDAALIELAAVMGIDSGPGRFEPPETERERLEAALGELGIDLELQTENVSHAPSVTS
jgi:hypothetical protein